MEVKELLSSEEWAEAIPILAELRTTITNENLLPRREELLSDGYRLVGLFHEGSLRTVAGFITYPHLTHGKDVWIHDLVTRREDRSKGFSKQVLKYIETLAKAEGCSRVCVHTRNTNEGALRFYAEHANYDNYASVFQWKLR